MMMMTYMMMSALSDFIYYIEIMLPPVGVKPKALGFQIMGGNVKIP